jgi:hypothetical protein
MGKRTSRCAYCGASPSKLEREHVVPACLYPASRKASRIQRLTVPACSSCNRGWADDEAHFRNVLLLAGDPNEAVNELWSTTARRSFDQVDGNRRLRDLLELMKPVAVEGRKRWKIFPAEDSRIIRVVRKIVRGLSHHHGIESALAEDRIWADILRYRAPPDLFSTLGTDLESDIFRYWYDVLDDDLTSIWLLTFFERRTFVASVRAEPGSRNSPSVRARKEWSGL